MITNKNLFNKISRILSFKKNSFQEDCILFSWTIRIRSTSFFCYIARLVRQSTSAGCIYKSLFVGTIYRWWSCRVFCFHAEFFGYSLSFSLSSLVSCKICRTRNLRLPMWMSMHEVSSFVETYAKHDIPAIESAQKCDFTTLEIKTM